MGTLLFFGFLGVVYLGIGALVALYEKSLTDDDFDWSLILKWPLRVFG